MLPRNIRGSPHPPFTDALWVSSTKEIAMPETQTTGTPGAAPKQGAAGDPTHYNKRTPEAADREQVAPAAEEATINRTAEAQKDAARANQEFLSSNLDTARDALRSGVEASAHAFETVTTSLTRTFGMAAPNGEVAEQTAQNVRAVSQASTALARGAQEASRAWFGFIQQASKANLEAMSQFAKCRSMQDIVAVQSDLARASLQQVIEGGETIARSTSAAVQEAKQAMQSFEMTR